MQHTAFASLLLLSAALLATPEGLGARTHLDPIPCVDPRGCPDLVVDALQLLVGTQLREHFDVADCAVNEGAVDAGNRSIVRFTFTSPNVGKGALIVGSPLNHPDLFHFDPCHGHFHLIEYADYRLWTLSGFQEWNGYRREHPELTAEQALRRNHHLQSELIAGRKQGFCMEDFAPALPNRYGFVVPPDPETFTSCFNQGIGRGWADSYIPTLDGQWIDITNQRPGAYVLEAEVNAERLVVESDYTNNRAWMPLPVFASALPPQTPTVSCCNS